ncbi:MAG: prolyl oligopeptidase family serine peptidase [Desulfobacteraceae bacterium]|nr:prolyl oligopeptidase family serine peptidase [Desulfobacteraceae bacterium]
MKINFIKIDFQVDGLTLKGVLHLPEIKDPPLVVGSHGLEGSSLSAKQMVLSRLLPAKGMAFFRFDHRGCGGSQGNFLIDTSLKKRTRDYIGAVRHILELNLTSRKLGIFGSSMGGATCINAWESLGPLGADICGGVICSAPVQSRTIENIPIQANGNRPALPLSFFKKNLLFNLLDKTKILHHLLIFHGNADEVVPVSNAHEIYARMQSPKKIIIHKGGDHQMTSKEHQAEFAREVVDWYLTLFKSDNKNQ